MAEMTRQKGKTWYPPNTWEHVNLQVLMDIRDELQALNQIMQCRNVAMGFRALAKIAQRDEKAFKRRVEHAVAKRVKRAAT
jgi:hypothetical protein